MDREKMMAGEELYAQRCSEAKEIICRYDQDLAWDRIQARDLDPKILEYVEDRIEQGWAPGKVCKSLGLPHTGCKPWKKILAHFRQGFRGDAEVYLYRETQRFYKVLQQAKVILEDAFENGTPELITETEYHEITGKPIKTTQKEIRIKGATRELAGFLKAYGESIALPVKLWKDYGAIGEKRDVHPGGIIIQVQNNIPMPSMQEIRQHQEEITAKALALEVKSNAVAGEILAPEESSETQS